MNAWRRSDTAELKRDKILDVLRTNPTLPSKRIADMTNSSQSYVKQVIGKSEFKNVRQVFNTRKNNPFPWKHTAKQFTDFIKNFMPTRTKEDFASHYLPTDDIMASSGSGSDDYASLSHFEWIAERRVGVGWKLTRKPADDAMRNRFHIVDFNGEIQDRSDIYEWAENTDFYNQLAQALYYERVYGCGFLVKYFTENDQENQDFSEPATKNGEEDGEPLKPIAFQAFPPTQMTPVNLHRTSYLDTDPQKWNCQGGHYNSKLVHHSRVHILMTRRVSHRWRGLSVFEPIWIPLMSYFQAQIYLLRAFAKMGSVIPYWLMDSNEDISALYDDKVDLLDEMKMNSLYIGKVGETFGFAETRIASGLTEMMEIWKEDIAAGTSIPLPILFGRAQASGMGSQMYLVFERYYWNEIANIQASISDDVRQILLDAGFNNLEKTRIDWKLAIQKTDQQRLVDEGMKIENEILKERYVQTQIQTMMLLEQAEAPVDENPNDNSNATPGNGGERELEKKQETRGSGNEEVKDFLRESKEVYAQIMEKRRNFIKDHLQERREEK